MSNLQTLFVQMASVFFQKAKCIFFFAPPIHHRQQSQYMANIVQTVFIQIVKCSCPKVQTVSVLIAKCICSSCQLLSVTQSPTSASRANTGKGIQPPDDQKKKAVHSLQPFLPPSAQPSFGPEPPNISTDKSYQPKWSLGGNHWSGTIVTAVAIIISGSCRNLDLKSRSVGQKISGVSPLTQLDTKRQPQHCHWPTAVAANTLYFFNCQLDLSELQNVFFKIKDATIDWHWKILSPGKYNLKQNIGFK